MRENHFDVIVAGVGSMGSAAVYQLARRGAKVLGLEQFGLVHGHGSHGGQSRIYRKAYFEHADYVPLLESAYAGWRKLEEEAGERLQYETGFLYIGKPDGIALTGVKRSASQFDIALEQKAINEFPMFSIPEGYEAVLEPGAGLVLPEKTVGTLVVLAQKHGARVQANEPMHAWEVKQGVVHVKTGQGNYTADKLVLTTGAYVNAHVPEIQRQLTVTRQWLLWMMPENPAMFELGRFPCWTVDLEDEPGIYYGFPILPAGVNGGHVGLKIAHHRPGEPAEASATCPAESRAEREHVLGFVRKHFPGALGEVVDMESCYYTYSPDEHFIIDHLPETDGQVTIACGFSGHGFKFVPVMGEILADLALDGRTEHPIGFLGLGRLGR
jgi:sarcosine oxidase